MYHYAPNAAPNDVESHVIPTDPNTSPQGSIHSSSQIHEGGDVIAGDARFPGQPHPGSLNGAPLPGNALYHSSNAIHGIPSRVESGDQIEGYISVSDIEELNGQYPGHYREDDAVYVWQTHLPDQLQQYDMQPSISGQMEDMIQTFSTRSFTLNEALHPHTTEAASATIILPPSPQLDLETGSESPYSTGYGVELDYESEETRSERDSQPPETPGESSTVIRSATGQKMHQCQICKRSFPRPGALTTHMYVHSGLRRKWNYTAA